MASAATDARPNDDGAPATLEHFVQASTLFTLSPAAPPTLMGAAAAGGDGKLLTLSDMLDAAGPNGSTPATSSVAVVPDPGAVATNQALRAQLSNVQLLQTFANVYAMSLLYKAHPDPYDITDPTQQLQFTNDVTNKLNYVMTLGMGKYLTLNKSTPFSFSRDATNKTIHTEFLNTMFSTFALPEDSLKQIDAQLTAVAAALTKVDAPSDVAQGSINHLMFMYYFKAVPGLEAEGIKTAHVRLLFLKVDTKSYMTSKKSGGKHSHTTNTAHYHFNMNYIDMDFDMNDEFVTADRDKIVGLVEKMGNASLDELNKATSPIVVKGEPKK